MQGGCMEELNIQWDKNGLLPCITQDFVTHEVLMLAYMNEEAFKLTIQTGIAHYFSRSKQRIWKKGEKSGHTQEVCSIMLDCDKDSLLLQVNQNGVACHTGKHSCFFHTMATRNEENKLEYAQSFKNSIVKQDSTQDSIANAIQSYDAFDILYHTLLERKCADINTSYTASLFAKGKNAIAKKIIEEAGEFCFAFKDGDIKEIIYECADVFYHILVALANMNIHPDRIYQELTKRMGTSGILEKQNRANINNGTKEK